ncbi:LAETG motif-containing sortase-dependent surface protein [Streptomyces griseus]|uniref:LAETG motif-containing sortase-dependent surface protein n=1 Tax=Streptomyces griseus TaxID=1911 RepID=UPI00084039DD|nr:LAETG motif-containing sortase-dependent surface protein [Streptomyces griseus]
MTVPRSSWRAAGTFAAAAVAGLAGGVLFAGPAAAHTPTWAVTCSHVTLDLTAYSDTATNKVTVSVVGGEDLLPTTTFGRAYRTEVPLQLPPHDKELTVRLVVEAGDDDRFSRDLTKTAPVCEEDGTPSPTPAEETPAPTPSAEPSASQTPEPSGSPTDSAPAPAGSSGPATPDLAETGSSSTTPVIGGAAVAVLLAGGGILWSVRKRRVTGH